jgi:DNA-binding beta-propeller fold protein YncE
MFNAGRRILIGTCIAAAAAAAAATDVESQGVKITDPTSVVMIVNRDSNDIGFMDIKSKKMIGNVFLGNNVNPHMVMMSPDGRYVVTGGTRANKAFIIDTRTLQLVKVIPTDIAPEHLAFSPDSRWYYQGNPDGDSISVIDMQSLSKIKTIPGFVEPLNVTFTPDGTQGLRRKLRRALVGRDRRASTRTAQEDSDRNGPRCLETRSW